MKPAVLLLPLLLVCFFARGQKDSSGKRIVYELPRKYTAIKFSPVNLVDIDNPNFLLALEKRFNAKNAIQLHAGWTLPIRYPDSLHTISKGFKIRVEYRRYYRQKPRNSDWFYSPEIFYTQYSAPRVNYYKHEDTSAHYKDEFVINKKMYGIAFRVGVQKRFGKHFVFESYTGIGFKYKHVTQTGRMNVNDKTSAIDVRAVDISDRLGEYSALVLPANIFLGYFF